MARVGSARRPRGSESHLKFEFLSLWKGCCKQVNGWAGRTPRCDNLAVAFMHWLTQDPHACQPCAARFVRAASAKWRGSQ